jgi:hypothetical protein
MPTKAASRSQSRRCDVTSMDAFGDRTGLLSFEERSSCVGVRRAGQKISEGRGCLLCAAPDRGGEDTHHGLERDGFVRRVPHAIDRRATIIELTDAGRAAHHAVYTAHADRAAALFASLSLTDQRHLARILHRLADALAQTSAAEGRPLDLDPAVFRSERSRQL